MEIATSFVSALLFDYIANQYSSLPPAGRHNVHIIAQRSCKLSTRIWQYSFTTLLLHANYSELRRSLLGYHVSYTMAFRTGGNHKIDPPTDRTVGSLQ